MIEALAWIGAIYLGAAKPIPVVRLYTLSPFGLPIGMLMPPLLASTHYTPSMPVSRGLDVLPRASKDYQTSTKLNLGLGSLRVTGYGSTTEMASVLRRE